MKEIKEMNIFEKMLAVENEIQEVKKNLKVGKGTSAEYKAVKEGDVLKAVKPIEKKYGIYSYPFDREILRDERITFKNKYGESENFVTRVKVIYRFVNTDKTEEFVDIISYGDGIDSQDKAPGKALTYADKYALLKAYKIETGDDENQKPAQIVRAKKLNEMTESEELKNIGPKILEFTKLRNETNTLPEDINKHFKVNDFMEMTEKQLDTAIVILKKKPITKIERNEVF